MPELIPVLGKDAIARKVAAVARRISADYGQRPLVLICVLKGAFVFTADLAREITLPQVEIDFAQLASYGAACDSSGQVRILKDIATDIQDKDVLIVDDILDTGLSLDFFRRHLLARRPRSLKICVMIDKQERRQVEIQADYACHTTRSGFLVGYGLDFAENYRHLPGLYHLNV
jgi:hypoxanthine phosphoribosyltransferase